MSDCTPACLVTAPSFSAVAGCGLLDNIRSGYISNFVAMRCDETVPDITDATAIGVQVAAGTVFTSPTITGEVPFPTVGDELVENCQPPQPTSRTYDFTFTSYRVDTTGFTDWAAWNSLSQKLTTWYIAPVTCDNVIIVPQDFATSGLLGFQMRGTISSVIPNESTMRYEGVLQFKYDQVLNGIPLSDAVIAALGLSGNSVT